MDVGAVLALPFFLAMGAAAVVGVRALRALWRGEHVVVDLRPD